MGKYSEKYRRQTHRCPNWDYAGKGIYFVTICTKYHSLNLGHIENRQMVLNELGHIVNNCWMQIPEIYTHVVLDEYVLMPDHLHGILHIKSEDDCSDVSMKRRYNKYHPRYTYQGPNPRMSQISAHPGSLPVILRMFKGATTKQIRIIDSEFTWQPRFHDRIIRSEYELKQIRKYIRENPKKYDI